MNITTAVVFLVFIGLSFVAVRGLFARRLSRLLGVLAGGVAAVAALLTWYAWVESRSVPWTLGYGLLFGSTGACAIRHLFGRRTPAGPPPSTPRE